MNIDPDKVYECPKCGGVHVQMRMVIWSNPNNEYDVEDIGETDPPAYRCNACGEIDSLVETPE